MATQLSADDIKIIESFQKNEITEHFIYMKLAKIVKDKNNSQLLERIGNEEKAHYDYWKTFTGADVKPNKFRIIWFFWIARILGLTFGIKLMERGESGAQVAYSKILVKIPDAKQIMEDEHEHEGQLIDMIDEESLQYVGSIVLGLNDALVELTGALAGLSLAFQNAKVIAMAGLITGIAAGFSMASSDYLAKKAEGSEKNAFKSAIYTGVAYMITTALLVIPYILLNQYFVCLMFTLIIAILIIFCFNFYISVAKDLNFKRRFVEMALISLGVAALTFGIGYLVKQAFGIEMK